MPLTASTAWENTKNTQKGKKKREKQDEFERRERPGEWNRHIKCALAIWPVTSQGFCFFPADVVFGGMLLRTIPGRTVIRPNRLDL